MLAHGDKTLRGLIRFTQTVGCDSVRLRLQNLRARALQSGHRSMRVLPRFFLILFTVVTAGVWLRSAEPEMWAVFGRRARVEIEVTQQNGNRYLDLVKALSADMESTSEATRKGARVRAGGTQFEVVDGQRDLHIRGKNVVLRSSALVQGSQVLVATDDLPVIVRAVTRVNVLARAGRTFIGDTADFASTQLRPGEPSSLILSFRNAVNPRVSADAKTVTLTFDRDPAVLIAPQSGFDDRTIASVQSIEQNGSAAITVTGEVPLMVKFEDQNRRIVVTAAPAAASIEPPSASATGSQPTEPENSAGAEPVTAVGAQPAVHENLSTRTAFVAIDPAHGGADAGVRFSDKLIEKDVTLELAAKIKTELSKLGISSIVLRNADDEDRGTDERAEMANGAHVNFYVGVHAGQGGTGVRLYTALPEPAQRQHGFTPWELAQADHRDDSAAFAAALSSQLNARKVAARQLAGNSAPITHIAAAAVAIEVAPQDREDDASIESQPYQMRVAQAVAAAIAGERNR